MEHIINMKNKTIGVTGSSGVLGNKFINKFKNNSFIKCTIDIQDRKKVFQWIGDNQFDLLLHFAAIVPINEVNKDKLKAKSVNYIGTKNIVDCLISSNIKWFFFSSTSHVYESTKKKIKETSKVSPISYYGKTKYLAEKYIIKKLLNTKTKYCIGRIFSTSNNNQKQNYLIPDLNKKIKKVKKLIKLNDLNHYRDFISMNEISKIIFCLYKKKFKGVINIGRGNGVLLKDIAILICKKFKKECVFIDNKKPTFLIANNYKLKRYYQLKKDIELKDLIF